SVSSVWGHNERCPAHRYGTPGTLPTRDDWSPAVSPYGPGALSGPVRRDSQPRSTDVSLVVVRVVVSLGGRHRETGLIADSGFTLVVGTPRREDVGHVIRVAAPV